MDYFKTDNYIRISNNYFIILLFDTGLYCKENDGCLNIASNQQFVEINYISNYVFVKHFGFNYKKRYEQVCIYAINSTKIQVIKLKLLLKNCWVRFHVFYRIHKSSFSFAIKIHFTIFHIIVIPQYS